MKKVIAIVGPSAAGKNTLLNKILENKNYNKVLHSTTRPIRDGEKNGREYYFLTNEEMLKLIDEGKIIGAAVYNHWCYALHSDSFVEDKMNIGDFNLIDLDCLGAEKDIKLYIIYVTASSKVRIIRSLLREEEPDIAEIYRRYLSDDEDFYWFEEDIKLYDNIITVDTTNDSYDWNEIIKFIEEAENE